MVMAQAPPVDFVSHYYTELRQLLAMANSLHPWSHFCDLHTREFAGLVSEYPQDLAKGDYMARYLRGNLHQAQFLRHLTQWFELHKLGLTWYASELARVVEGAKSVEEVVGRAHHMKAVFSGDNWHHRLIGDRYTALIQLLERVPTLPVEFLLDIANSPAAPALTESQARLLAKLASVVDSVGIRMDQEVALVANDLESAGNQSGLILLRSLVTLGVLRPQSLLIDHISVSLDVSFAGETSHLAAIRMEVLKKPFSQCTPEEVVTTIEALLTWPWNERIHDIQRNLSKITRLSNVMPGGGWLCDLDVAANSGPIYSKAFKGGSGGSGNSSGGGDGNIVRHQKKFGKPSNGDNPKDEPPKKTKNEKNTEYVQIPEKIFIHMETKSLLATRDLLSRPFADCTAEEVIEAAKKIGHGATLCDEADANRLYSKLYRLFAVNGGDTGCLDQILLSNDTFAQFEQKLKEKQQSAFASAANTTNGHQITSVPSLPVDLGIDKFTQELDELRLALGGTFALVSSSDINDYISKEIYSGKNPGMVSNQLFTWIRLGKRLERLFAVNGGNTAVLDDVKPVYVQIPDDGEIHGFADELGHIQKQLGSKFKDATPQQILDIVGGNTKLVAALNHLFKINGNDTQCLDGVVASNKAFAQLETRTPVAKKTVESSTSSQLVRPIPDDFRIDEFTTELERVRHHLGVKRLSLVSPQEILDGCERLGTQGSVYYKLYANLKWLFAVNGGNSLLLDAVILSKGHFDAVEASKREYCHIPEDLPIHEFAEELKELKNDLGIEKFAQSSPEDILDGCNNFATGLVVFGKLYANLIRLFVVNGGDTSILDTVIFNEDYFHRFESTKMPLLLGKVAKLMNDNFDIMNSIAKASMEGTNKFATVVSGLDQTHPIVMAEVRGIAKEAIELPGLIDCLVNLKLGRQGKPLTEADVEETYTAMLAFTEGEASVESKILAGLVEPKEEVSYNDSERLVQLLSQQTTPVDLEEMDRELFHTFDQGGKKKSLAKTGAIAGDGAVRGSTAGSVPGSIAGSGGDSHPVNPERLANFLTEAQLEQKRTAQDKARAQQAFSWAHHKLDPKLDYKMLTKSGRAIPVNSLLVQDIKHQPVDKILAKIPAEDLDVLLDNLHKYEARGWKVAGLDQVNGDYILLIAKPLGKSKWKWMRNFLATAGLGFIGILGIEFFIEPVRDDAESGDKMVGTVEKSGELLVEKMENLGNPEPSIVKKLMWDSGKK